MIESSRRVGRTGPIGKAPPAQLLVLFDAAHKPAELENAFGKLFLKHDQLTLKDGSQRHLLLHFDAQVRIFLHQSCVIGERRVKLIRDARVDSFLAQDGEPILKAHRAHTGRRRRRVRSPGIVRGVDWSGSVLEQTGHENPVCWNREKLQAP